jgi:hypothetical protein
VAPATLSSRYRRDQDLCPEFHQQHTTTHNRREEHPCSTPHSHPIPPILPTPLPFVTVLKKKRISSAFDSPDNEEGLTQDPSDDDFAEDSGPKKRRSSMGKKRNSTVPASPLAGVGGGLLGLKSCCLCLCLCLYLCLYLLFLSLDACFFP